MPSDSAFPWTFPTTFGGTAASTEQTASADSSVTATLTINPSTAQNASATSSISATTKTTAETAQTASATSSVVGVEVQTAETAQTATATSAVDAVKVTTASTEQHARARSRAIGFSRIPGRRRRTDVEVEAAGAAVVSPDGTAEAHPYVFAPASNDGFAVTFDRTGDDAVRLTAADLMADPRLEFEPNTVSDWEVELSEAVGLEGAGRAATWIYYDGTLLMRGELQSVESESDSSRTTVGGRGMLADLKRGGTDVTFANVPATEAIREYWDEQTAFEAEVIEPEFGPVVADGRAQDADETDEFDALFDPDDAQPYAATADGFGLLQQCFHLEAEDFVAGDVNLVGESDDYSGGQVVRLGDPDDETDSEDDEWFEVEFDLEYTIPSIFFGCKVRDTQGDENNLPEFEWYLVDPDGREHGLDYNDDLGRDISLGWSEVAFEDEIRYRGRYYDGPDLEPGTYRIGVRATNTEGGTAYFVDLICPYDARYLPTTRDQWMGQWHAVDSNGALPGPPTARPAPIETEPFEQDFNVTAARLNVGITNGSSEEQRIQVSNDGGDTWLPDGSGDGGADGRNTDRIDVTFDDTYGITATGKLRLDATSPEGARDTTPAKGYARQVLTDWELRYDANNRRVIESADLTGSDWKNLKDLHEDAGMIMTAHHATDARRATSLAPGGEERDLGDVRIEGWTREYDPTGYANRLTVYGGTSDVTGERLSVTVDSPAEIDAHGEVVEAEPVERDDITDRFRLRAVANRLLAEHIDATEFNADISIVPKFVQPGFAYRHEIWEDEPLILRRVSFDPASPSGNLKFGDPDDFAEVLRSLDAKIDRSRS